MSLFRTFAMTVLCAVAVASAAPARAGSFYFAGQLGLSAERAEASGENTRFVPTDLSGSDEDASPIFGGALGFAFPLNDALPWEIDTPRWMGESFVFPRWMVRPEFEGRYGRGSEFRTDGLSPATPHRSEVTSWSLMHNLWLDVPVHTPIEALFGRIPILEPLTVYGGVGLGVAGTDLSTSDTIVSGEDTTYSFAWQAGGGLGYALTEWAHIDLGYRYVDLGTAETDLEDGPLPAGDFALDLTAHEFTTTLRFHFYSVPFPARPR